MREEDIGLIRSFYEGLNRGERGELLPVAFDPEVEWRPAREDPDPSIRRGHQGVAAFFETWTDLFDPIRVHPERIDDMGECALVDLHVVGRGRGSGADVDQRVFQCIRMRGGRITQVDEFYDRGEALEFAAGSG